MGSDRFFEVLRRKESVADACAEFDKTVESLRKELAHRLTVDEVVAAIRAQFNWLGDHAIGEFEEYLRGMISRKQCGCTGSVGRWSHQ